MKKSPGRPAPKATAARAASRPMTKRQLSRHQRDLMLQRYTKIGFGALFAIVVLVVIFGYWREVLAPGGEAILSVRGVPVSTQTYAKVLGYQQYAIDLRIANMRAFANQQARSNPDDQESAGFLQQLVQQQVQQLQTQRASLESQVIEQLIRDELVRQEAVKRGISVAVNDEDDAIYNEFVPPTPAATPAASADQTTASAPSGTPTPEANAPAIAPTENVSGTQPTATPISREQAMLEKRQELSNLGLMTEQEYRDLIVRPMLLSDRLEAQLAEKVPTSSEQVWARHILVDQEDQAKDVLSKLQGGADFAALAKEQSKDTSNNEKGGDLGWFKRGDMVPEFEEAAFSLQVGQTVTEPLKTTFGYHVIQVLGHEQNRPLTEEQLKQAKENALSSWVQTQRTDDPNAVQYGYSSQRMTWARNWISKNAKYLQAQQQPVPGR